jgi:hypothetical protein
MHPSSHYAHRADLHGGPIDPRADPADPPCDPSGLRADPTCLRAIPSVSALRRRRHWLQADE